MSFFEDVDKRKWRIRLTGPMLEKVRDATKINLATPSGEGALEATADGEILTRVLLLLCGDQEPDGKKLTPEQFGEAVASGDVFEAAQKALHEAILDFTLPSRREMLQTVLETAEKEQAARAEIVKAKLNGDELHDRALKSFRVALDNRFEQLLTRLENVGDSPDSPDSTPTPPPSES